MLRKRKGDQTTRLSMIDLQTTRIQYLWLNSLHFLLYIKQKSQLCHLLKNLLPTNSDNTTYEPLLYGLSWYPHLFTVNNITTTNHVAQFFCRSSFFLLFTRTQIFSVFAQTWSDRWDIFMEVLSFLRSVKWWYLLSVSGQMWQCWQMMASERDIKKKAKVNKLNYMRMYDETLAVNKPFLLTDDCFILWCEVRSSSFKCQRLVKMFWCLFWHKSTKMFDTVRINIVTSVSCLCSRWSLQ